MANIPPLPPSQVPAPSGAVRIADARAAFFRQALASAAGPAAATAQNAPVAPSPAHSPGPAATVRAASDGLPERYMRPGSIINIRV